MATSGILPAVINTLQFQFGFSSTASGVLMTLFDVIGIITCVPVGYYGAKYNKARVTTYGFILSVVGCWLFVLPLAVLPMYKAPTDAATGTEYCSASNLDRSVPCTMCSDTVC